MKYLALIYASEQEQMSKGEAHFGELIKEYDAYGSWLVQTHPGKKLGGDALQPTQTATTIRVRDGKRMVTDGPFAETKEQLGGFYVFEAHNLDEAIELAARIPDAKNGCIEVRPIMTFDAP